MSESKQSNMASIFGGAGLGIATGLFMGLSVSPTVGVVIGAITSSLALFLGFSNDHTKAKSLSIGAFGLMAALSALLGLYIRSNDVLSPSVQDIYDSYIEIGFSEAEARNFARFKKLGILEDDWRMAFPEGTPGDSTGANVTSATVYQAGTSMLFSKEVDVAACDFLIVNEQTPLANIIADIRSIGDKGWDNMLNAVTENIAETDQKQALLLIATTVCQAETSLESCMALRPIDLQTDLSSLETIYSNTGYMEVMKPLLSGFQTDEAKRQALIILSKTLCNEG